MTFLQSLYILMVTVTALLYEEVELNHVSKIWKWGVI